MVSVDISGRGQPAPVGLTLLANGRETPSIVPVPPTPLVGRDRELIALAELLADADVRLVTLTGTGGVGKTRLALEAVRSVECRVVYVPLATIFDPALVPLTIAQHLGLGDLGPRPIDILARFLRAEPVLLVLDNAEQVLPAAPLIAELLAQCPLLKVLVTSRVRLRLSGEHEFIVPPLTLPAAVGQTGARRHGASQVLNSGAGALFVQRAQAIDRAFTLTDENAGAVAEICQRLDGLPLALELAASRCKVLPPSALLARLATRLDLLTGASRDVPGRQRTMRDAIAWSYDLLSPAEQACFRRLAVFVDGFTLETAAAVLAGQSDAAEMQALAGDLPGTLDATTLLDVIGSLVDHCLLHRIPDPSGEPRFAMLETIREYGAERLSELGEGAVTRRRHATYFLAVAEAATLEFNGPRQLHWLEWLATERSNLREALAWFEERGETGPSLRLAAAIGLFHWCRGHHREGRSLLERVLALPDAPRHGAAWAAAMTALGLQVAMQGDYEQAAKLHETAIAAWRTLSRPAELTHALWLYGLGLLAVDPPGAGVPFAESLELARELGEPWMIAYAMWGLGQVTRLASDAERAAATFEEALAILGDGASQTASATTYWTYGQMAWDRGDTREAAALHGTALEGFRQIGKPWGGVDCVEALAVLAGQRGRSGPAVQLLAAADAWREAVGMWRPPLAAPVYELAVSSLRSALGDDAFAAAWVSGQDMPPEQSINTALSLAAELGAEQSGPTRIEAPSPLSDLGLTRREIDVLRLLTEGCSDREIADALSISPRTVGGHVTNLLGKLEVRSRSAAAAYAIRLGVLEQREPQIK